VVSIKVTELEPIETTAIVRWFGRETDAVNEQLPVVKRTERTGNWIAEPDDA
jgi:hypothetical protein